MPSRKNVGPNEEQQGVQLPLTHESFQNPDITADTGKISRGPKDDPLTRQEQSHNFQVNQKRTARKERDARLKQEAAEGGGSGTAEAQDRGAGGGSFGAQGDFGPGAIRINTVTPVNSKVGGR